MISQLLDLILEREFFPFLLRKTKTEERRADEPSAGKMPASEAVPRGNLRVCVKKTSCLPNDGSRLTDTNLTNKGKSVIGTMKYQFFWQQTSLKAAGGKKTRNTSLQRKTPWRNASLWVPTPRSSTSKLAGGRSFWNLSR